MAYKVGQVQATGGGYGFNITGEHSRPLVTFTYETSEEAEKAAALV